jgi:hypothetical protein
MTVYRQKVVDVEAIQWTGENELELIQFTNNQFEWLDPDDRTDDPDQDAAVFESLHSRWVGVYPTDWILKDSSGSLSKISNEKFEQTYEPLEKGN